MGPVWKRTLIVDFRARQCQLVGLRQ